MGIARFLSVLLIAFVAAACSTTVSTRVAMDTATKASLKFGDIEVTSTFAGLPVDVNERLKAAVAERLAKLPQGTLLVKVNITVTNYRIVSNTERFLIGMFGGSNKMSVSVKLIDEQGKSVSEFDVERSANPGGYGAFYDQKDATVAAVADGIAETLGPGQSRK
jgi:hypothetical protein